MANTGNRGRTLKARGRPFRAEDRRLRRCGIVPRSECKGRERIACRSFPGMIAAAEEAEMSTQQLTVAKNKLEQNKVRRDEAEIEDFFGERQKRLQEQEAAELRRYEEQLEAES